MSGYEWHCQYCLNRFVRPKTSFLRLVPDRITNTITYRLHSLDSVSLHIIIKHQIDNIKILNQSLQCLTAQLWGMSTQYKNIKMHEMLHISNIVTAATLKKIKIKKTTSFFFTLKFFGRIKGFFETLESLKVYPNWSTLEESWPFCVWSSCTN